MSCWHARQRVGPWDSTMRTIRRKTVTSWLGNNHSPPLFHDEGPDWYALKRMRRAAGRAPQQAAYLSRHGQGKSRRKNSAARQTPGSSQIRTSQLRNGSLGLDFYKKTTCTNPNARAARARAIRFKNRFETARVSFSACSHTQSVSCRASVNLRSLRNGAYRLRVRRLRGNGARPRGSERARLRAAAPLCETRPRGRASKPAGTRYVTSCHLTWRETEAPQYQSLGTGAAPA